MKQDKPPRERKVFVPIPGMPIKQEPQPSRLTLDGAARELGMSGAPAFLNYRSRYE